MTDQLKAVVLVLFGSLAANPAPSQPTPSQTQAPMAAQAAPPSQPAPQPAMVEKPLQSSGGPAMEEASPDPRPVVAWMGAPLDPPFTEVKTGSRVMMGFGVIGGLIAASQELSDGAQFRQQMHLTNPAADVARGVATEFAHRNNAQVSPRSASEEASAAAGKLPHPAGAAWLVAVRTVLWG